MRETVEGVPSDQEKSLASRLAYWIRDRLNSELFSVIPNRLGDVLDVGGGTFFLRLESRGASWTSYTVLEPSEVLVDPKQPSVRIVCGDAHALPFPESAFDEILAIQVLEHVFSPESAVREMWRVLRADGRLIILVPQSGNLHLVPEHYANLTRFWLFEMARRLGAEVELWLPLGGSWRTIASRLFLMFWPVMNWHETRDPELHSRGVLFWLLLPVQVVVSAIFFPIALLLSLGDIREEANNHLIVLRKK